MVLPKEIIESLRQKSGLRLNASGDFKLLIDAIYAETNEVLGMSTIKRLLGFFADTRSPHRSTLDIIAHYLGAPDWDTLLTEKCGNDSDFDSSLEHIDTTSMAEDAVLRICYHPGRKLEIRHISGPEFEVQNYNGTKLRMGDRLFIYEIVRHFPLFIKDVVREGYSLGAYIAARRNGVQETVIYPPPFSNKRLIVSHFRHLAECTSDGLNASRNLHPAAHLLQFLQLYGVVHTHTVIVVGIVIFQSFLNRSKRTHLASECTIYFCPRTHPRA